MLFSTQTALLGRLSKIKDIRCQRVSSSCVAKIPTPATCSTMRYPNSTRGKAEASDGSVVNVVENIKSGGWFPSRLLISSAITSVFFLCYVKGPKSFEDIRTVEGVAYHTFQLAAKALGLLEDDSEWFRAMEDAVGFQIPRQLRHLFAIILSCCPVSGVKKLWDDNVFAMSEPHQRQLGADVEPARVTFLTLRDINKLLLTQGKSLTDFPSLPQLDEYEEETTVLEESNPFVVAEASYNQDTLQHLVDQVEQLNANQAHVYRYIVDAARRSRFRKDTFP